MLYISSYALCFEQVEVERIDVCEPHVLGILNTHTHMFGFKCMFIHDLTVDLATDQKFNRTIQLWIK